MNTVASTITIKRMVIVVDISILSRWGHYSESVRFKLLTKQSLNKERGTGRHESKSGEQNNSEKHLIYSIIIMPSSGESTINASTLVSHALLRIDNHSSMVP